MFDLTALADAVATHGRVARVVIASFKGSSPREVGAAMLVWADGQSGTIGGGALEWQAAARARDMLALTPPPTPSPSPRGGGEARVASFGPVPEIGRCATPDAPVSSPPPRGEGLGVGGALGVTDLAQVPLGPALGQCCGGAVTLLTEVYHADNLPEAAPVIARALDGSAMPLAVKRLIDRARARGEAPAPQMLQGWMVEPIAAPSRQLWVWGAGHVGRALIDVLAPLPGLAITWVDTGLDRFPPEMPLNVRALPVADPAQAVGLAPKDGEHLILTYSHALDLELCHRLLIHGFAACGLIGSATKWARFRARLGALGHSVGAISRIDCPIGDPSLGKHPQAIAIGVAATFLSGKTGQSREKTGT